MAEVKQQTPTGVAPAPSAPNTGAATGNRVYRQIEQSADYYEPSIYSALTFCRTLDHGQTSLDQDFVPLTPSAYKLGDSKQKGLMFVVGLMPPTSNISGRYLDRSGTVGQLKGTGITYELSSEEAAAAPTGSSQYGGRIVTAPGYTIPLGTGKSDIGAGVPNGVDCGGKIAVEVNQENKQKRNFNCGTQLSMREMYQGLHDAYVRKFKREPTPTEIQIITAHCWRETSGYLPANNPGYLGNFTFRPGDPTNVGFQDAPGKVRGFLAFKTPAEGFDAYFARTAVGRNPNVLAAAQQGDILGFLTSLAQGEYFGEPLDQYYNNHGKGGGYPAILSQVANAIPEAGLGSGKDLPKNVPDACGFKETTDQYRKRTQAQTVKGSDALPVGDPARISRFNKNSPYGSDCPLEGAVDRGGDGTTGGWATGGSKQADAKRKQEEKTAQLRADREKFGRDLMDAQASYVQAAQVALETMKAMPPLRMLVNPTQFSVQGEKVISDGNQSRDGFIVEHWGDGQDKVEGSGVVAGFYSADINDARAPGLGRTARTWSASFQNFLSLWLLYRNNGGMWLPENKESIKTYLSVLGSIYIYYDGVLYLGSFDSFDLTETDDKPHSLEYSFSFTVRAWFLLDRQDDNSFGYGADALFKVSDAAPAVNDPAKQTAASQAAAEQRKADAIAKRDEAAKSDPARIYGLGTFGERGPDNPPTGGARTAGGQAPRGKAGGQSGPPKAPGTTAPTKAPAAPPKEYPPGTVFNPTTGRYEDSSGKPV